MKSNCPQCKRPVPVVAMCPFCGAATGQGSPATQALAGADEVPVRKAVQSLASERPPTPKVAGRVPIHRIKQHSGPGRWGWLLAGLIVLAAGVTWWMMPNKVRLDTLSPLASTADDPCQARPKCVLVFVAPDAPGVARSKATIKRMQQRFSDGDVAFGIIIGADATERSTAYAERFGDTANTWIDDGVWGRDNRIRMLPTWFVLNQKRRATAVVEGTFLPFDYHLEKLGL